MNSEDAIRLGLSAYLLEELGFEAVLNSKLPDQLKTITPNGTTAMRDSISLAMGMMLKLYLALNELGVAENWNFVHIVLTDGEDNASKSSLSELSKQFSVISDSIPVEMLKTYIIGVDMGSVKSDIKRLVELGGENAEYMDIGTADIEETFAKLRVKLGIMMRQELLHRQIGGMQMIAVQENAVPAIEVEEQHYMVLFNIDISGSMESKWPKVCRAVEKFIGHLGNGDLVGGLVFNQQVKLVKEFGNQRPAPRPSYNYSPIPIQHILMQHPSQDDADSDSSNWCCNMF